MLVDSNSTTVSQLEEKLENEDIHCSLFVSSFPLKIPVIMPMLKGVLQYSSPKFDTCIGFTEQIMLYSLPSSGITNVTHLNIALAANPDLIVSVLDVHSFYSLQISAATYATQNVLLSIFRSAYVSYEPDFQTLLDSLYDSSTGVIAISGPTSIVHFFLFVLLIGLVYESR